MADNALKQIDIATMPLTLRHYYILMVVSMGQILGAALATLIGIVIPLIQIVLHPELSSIEQGVIASAELIGIMCGSSLFGRLSDKYGYLIFFRLCPLLVLCTSLAAYWIDNVAILTPLLFIMGLGIGGEYSLDPSYISELMPKKWKLFMVGVSKASSSLGNLMVAVVCFMGLSRWHDAALWNRLFLIISALCAIMVLTRIRFANSPAWLITHGKVKKAEKAVRFFLGDGISIDSMVQKLSGESRQKVSVKELLSPPLLGKTILGSIPWACEGVGVYGIGVFTPLLVLSLGLESASELPYLKVLSSVEITAYINLFIIVGFTLGLLLIDRLSHIRIQATGFVLCAMGMLLIIASYNLKWPGYYSLIGFIIFEIFLNAGPHLITFVLPSQIYDVKARADGAGLCATFGKVGAVAGVFFIPLLLKWGGINLVLWCVVGIQLIGALITVVFGRKK